MNGVNKVILVGNLGGDPELRATNRGIPVCNFSLATAEKWKSYEGEQRRAVQWHKIVIFGDLANVACKFLKKGSQVFIEGRLQTRSFEKDGQKLSVTEILAHSITFLSLTGRYGNDISSGDEFIDTNSDSEFNV